jgi:hypothetical protein
MYILTGLEVVGWLYIMFNVLSTLNNYVNHMFSQV